MRFSVESLVFFVYSFCARQSPVYRTVIFVYCICQKKRRKISECISHKGLLSSARQWWQNAAPRVRKQAGFRTLSPHPPTKGAAEGHWFMRTEKCFRVRKIKKWGCKKRKFFYSPFGDRKKGSEWVNRTRRCMFIHREVRFARSKKGVLKPCFMKKHKNCCFESFCLSFKPLLFCIFQPFLRSGLFLHPLFAEK